MENRNNNDSFTTIKIENEEYLDRVLQAMSDDKIQKYNIELDKDFFIEYVFKQRQKMFRKCKCIIQNKYQKCIDDAKAIKDSLRNVMYGNLYKMTDKYQAIDKLLLEIEQVDDILVKKQNETK